MEILRKGIYNCCRTVIASDHFIQCSTRLRLLTFGRKTNSDFTMQYDEEPDLTDFPHSFQLDGGSRKAALIRLQRQEETALTAGQYTTAFDVARVHNLLAYILCTLKKGPEALVHVHTVLESQDKNIVSLANKVVILRRLGELREASEAYQRLKDLQQDEDFEYLKVLANAELAECYARSGRHMNKKAIELFKEVIPKGREPEVWSWRYGLALMYRQAGSLQCVLNASNDTSRFPRLSLRQLKRVINGSTDETLKAKAYTEIAWLIFSTLDREMKMKLVNEAGIGMIEACNKALQLDYTNTSVLRKVGRIFRYAKGEYLNIACRLLERALSFQESSAIYHDLGLTYKAMALRSKKASLREEAYKERKRRLKRKHLRKKNKWKERKAKKCPTNRTHYTADVPVDANDAKMVAKLCKMIKSPPVGAMLELSPGDEYVANAVHSLKKSVEFSEGENTRAAYDLALMFLALGETNEALRIFDSICKRDVLLDQDASVAPLDVIAAYEQYGLILLSERRKEPDNAEKKKMLAEGLLKLEKSLQIAARVYTRKTPLGKYSKIMWKSLAILMKIVEESNTSMTEKLKKKIRLIRMINRPRELRRFMKPLRAKARKEKDVEGLKMCVEDDCEKRKWQTFVPLTNILLRAMKRDEREEYLKQGVLQKVFIETARQQLTIDRLSAKYLLKSVFSDVHASGVFPTDDVCSSADTGRESAANSEDRFANRRKYRWDVILLHDDGAEGNAQNLEHTLRELCGLSVTCMDEDVTPGHLSNAGTIENIGLSCVVIVLLANTDNSFEREEECAYLEHVPRAEKKTFVLKVKCDCHIPSNLPQKLPQYLCQPALWEITTSASHPEDANESDENSAESILPESEVSETTMQPLDESSVTALCSLFQFLLELN
ncbi:uncharacterized protein [Littorina saxatilis]|uniref:uncharacterized protein n=1 Tax=Littorina saxatilis TaxID=31220 RepID=UPI0038B5D5B0